VSESIEFVGAITFIFGVLYFSGAFKWADHRINSPSSAAGITPGDIAIIRADIEKLKLALNLKEFKR